MLITRNATTSGTVSRAPLLVGLDQSITTTRKIVVSRGSIAVSKPFHGKREHLSETAPMTIAEAYIRPLRSLTEDWDGEGAPAPSKEAFENAFRVLVATLGHAMTPAYVEADVLGGVAIGFDSDVIVGERPKRSAWVACMNNGSVSVALRDRSTDNKSRGNVFRPENAGALADFINCVT